MFLYKSATSAEKSTEPTLVTKHGSHNQKTHAGSRGGGGGGGSGSASSKPSARTSDADPEFNNKLGNAIDRDADKLYGKMESLSAQVTSAATSSSDLIEAKKLSRAQFDIQSAMSALMPLSGIKNNKEKIRKLNRAAEKMSAATKKISPKSNETLLNAVNEVAMDTSDAAIGFMAGYANLAAKYSG